MSASPHGSHEGAPIPAEQAEIIRIVEANSPDQTTNYQVLERLMLFAAQRPELVSQIGMKNLTTSRLPQDTAFDAQLELWGLGGDKRPHGPRFRIWTMNHTLPPEMNNQGVGFQYVVARASHYPRSNNVYFVGATVARAGFENWPNEIAKFNELDAFEDLEARDIFLKNVLAVMQGIFDPLKPRPEF